MALRFGREVPEYVAQGFAHRPTETAIIHTTRFGIASGTKGITAAAILEYIDRGIISFESRLSDLLPDLSSTFSKDITVKHLLTHTSGVPDYCDEELGCDFEAIWSDIPVYSIRYIDDLLPLFANNPMKFSPGLRFSYSNSGFLILGLILESLAGIRYTEFIETHLFSRLGMNSSGFFPSDSLPPNSAIGYIKNQDGTYRSNVFAIPIVGAPDGGVYVNASDIIQFWDVVLTTNFLSPVTVDTIRSTSIEPTGEGNLGYSLGFWRADSWGNDAYFVLMGSDPGVSFYTAFSPKSGNCFAILSNTDDGAWKLVKPAKELLISEGAPSI